MGIQSKYLFPFCLKQKLNGFLEIGQTFLPILALAIGTGNLQASRPKAAFVRLALM